MWGKKCVNVLSVEQIPEKGTLYHKIMYDFHNNFSVLSVNDLSCERYHPCVLIETGENVCWTQS